MSSPAAIPRTFINMSASSPIIDLTISPVSVRRTEVVIISDNEDENVPSHNHNSSSYHLNDNNINSALGQNIFNSSTSRHSSNNNQDSSSNNLRSGLGIHSSNGSGPNRNTSTRPSRRPSTLRGLVNIVLNVAQANSNSHNNRHRHHRTSAFHPYAPTEFLIDDIIHYENSNSSGSSRTIPSFYEPARANTNINNSNDIQIITPPRRRTNNSPKPTTLVGHARDLDDSHTLICADCDGLLHEKLWSLSSCGHVVCGSCVDKYLEKKKSICPSCSKKITKPATILQLYV